MPPILVKKTIVVYHTPSERRKWPDDNSRKEARAIRESLRRTVAKCTYETPVGRVFYENEVTMKHPVLHRARTRLGSIKTRLARLKAKTGADYVLRYVDVYFNLDDLVDFINDKLRELEEEEKELRRLLRSLAQMPDTRKTILLREHAKKRLASIISERDILAEELNTLVNTSSIHGISPPEPEQDDDDEDDDIDVVINDVTHSDLVTMLRSILEKETCMQTSDIQARFRERGVFISAEKVLKMAEEDQRTTVIRSRLALEKLAVKNPELYKIAQRKHNGKSPIICIDKEG